MDTGYRGWVSSRTGSERNPAVWLLFSFVSGIYIYHGQRMFPALKDGDLIVISRLSAPKAGDIAAYSLSGDKMEFSRVIGTTGYDIDISELGELKTNGYVPLESIYYRTERAEGSPVRYPVTVSEGALFLLDDYRTIGLDSRTFGTVSGDQIKGKVVYILRRRGF